MPFVFERQHWKHKPRQNGESGDAGDDTQYENAHRRERHLTFAFCRAARSA
jgi:hypothetical protein